MLLYWYTITSFRFLKLKNSFNASVYNFKKRYSLLSQMLNNSLSFEACLPLL